MRITMVGDVFLGDQLACFGFGVRSLHAHNGYASCFTHAPPLFRGSDIVFANLESPLGLPATNQHHLRTLLSRGTAEGARALRTAGVQIVNLANNHSFEHGANGLEDTVRHLDEAQVAHVGTTIRPVHFTSIGDIKVAFLGWSMVPDRYWPGLRARDHYHVTEDIEEVLEEVAGVRERVDRIVLGLHWGHEWVKLPSTQQMGLAHRLVDAGVDVLAGHHPHVVQPVERHRGKIIAYSLRNFIFDVWSGDDVHGLVLTVDARDMTYDTRAIKIDRDTFGPSLDVNECVERDIEAVLRDGARLSESDAAAAAFQNRRRYRSKLARHAMSNFRSFALKRQLIWLGLRRLLFLLVNRARERTDPYVVYRGPMK